LNTPEALFRSGLRHIKSPLSRFLKKFQRYAKQVQEALNQNQVRTISLGAAETLSKRIRQAEKIKIPYIVVVGQNEEKSKTVSLRQRGKGDIGVHKLDNFIERLKKEIKAKK
jgi:Threonyl-tRNA synthetase